MTSTPRDILVTAALPYANADLHLGHMVEATLTDIWVRFQRLRGHQCRWMWACDAHGTPIMLRAKALGITPLELVEQIGASQKRDYSDFLCAFDNYYTTHSEENRQCAEEIYRRLRDNGHIHQRTIQQLYDPQEQMFLPDRFVKGECPSCGAEDQYGDNCEVCAATYDQVRATWLRPAMTEVGLY